MASRQQRRAFERDLARAVERSARAGDVSRLLELAQKSQNDGHFSLALRCYLAAVDLAADDPAAHVGLAFCLDQLGRTDEAIRHARRALRADPDAVSAYELLSLMFRKQDRITEAIATGRRAVELAPDRAMANRVIALALMDAGSATDAATYAARAIELEPRYEVNYVNAGAIHVAAGDLETAAQVYADARAAGFSSDRLAWNESLVLMGLERLDEAWDKYEHGFAAGQRLPDRGFSVPSWQGEDLSGRTVLVWREQGLGDEVRFLGCVPDLLELAEHVVIEVTPRLRTLVQRSFPAATVRGENTAPHDEIDLYCPLGSLPRWLRRSRADFPDHRGFLAPDPDRTARFRTRLAPVTERRLTVGIAWRSGNLDTRRLAAYLTLDELAPVLELDDVSFVSLQYGDARFCQRELDELESATGLHVQRWDDVDYTNDLEAVAALTSLMDVVVGPGSFPVDLACALGVPSYRLTKRSPWSATEAWWYPSAEAVERPPDEGWEGSVRYVAEELRRAAIAARVDPGPD